MKDEFEKLEDKMMKKIEVNGPGTDPLYAFLKAQTAITDISWNFAVYFLVDRAGSIRAYNLRPDGNEIGYDLSSELLADLDAALHAAT